MILYIAMLSMLVDHVGGVFFPEHDVLRIIGRLAFPLYAFGICEGLRHTKSFKVYHMRLWGLALVSQLPFVLAFEVMQLNVIFTFIFSIYAIKLLEYKELHKSLSIGLVVAIGVFMELTSDYGLYGLLMVLMYRCISEKGKLLAVHGLLNVLHFFLFGWYVQLFSLIATYVINDRERIRSLGVNKLLYRSFYPAHLAIICILKLFI